MRVRLVALALIAMGLVVLAAGCGGEGGEEATTSARPATSTSTKPAVNPVKVVSARLSGGAAVPKGAATGEGSATITLNTRSGRACWQLRVKGIDKPLSAHIHEGPVGEVGQVVVPLGDRFARKGCVLSAPRALRQVAAAASKYYVDIHTTKFLDGAVRGQLRAAHA